MATKKTNQNEVIAIYLLATAAATALAFNLYLNVKLRKPCLTGLHSHRVFNLGSGWAATLSSGIAVGTENGR